MSEESFDIVVTKKKEIFVFIFNNKFKKEDVSFRLDQRLKNIIISFSEKDILLKNIKADIIKRIEAVEDLTVFEIKNGEVAISYLVKKKPL